MSAQIYFIHFNIKTEKLALKMIKKYSNQSCHIEKRGNTYTIIRHSCLLSCKYCDPNEQVLRDTEQEKQNE